MADDSIDGTIKLENCSVCPAKVIGPVETYQWPSFVLKKSKWLPDEEADCCFICHDRFNQVRRKHHCRQCGKIICKSCCKNKIHLPQLGLEKQEKVCSLCYPVADLVAKARSSCITFRVVAAKELAEFSRDPQMVSKVVEVGGVQALVALATVDQPEIQEGVMQGLHSLSMHQSLHNTLIQSGAVKAISHILEKSSTNSNISADGISAIHIFCKTTELISKVLQDGALLPVLSLCHSGGAISLVAMKTLCIIAKDKETHSIIVDSQRVQALPQIFQFLNSSEPQMQSAAVTILTYISTSNNWCRHQLIQKDMACGQNINSLLEGSTLQQEVVTMATTLVANLAVCSSDTVCLSNLQKTLCSLLNRDHPDNDTLHNILRGIANFSKFKLNAPTLMQYLPQIIQKGLMSEHERIKQQTMRAISFLLAYMPEQTTEHLLGDGAGAYLIGISRFEKFFKTMNGFFSNICPEVVDISTF